MTKNKEIVICDSILGTDDCWCVIPVYNNCVTVQKVAQDCRKYLRNVVVVDDGSTDIDVRSLFHDEDITVLRHDKNLGKGKAILTALKYVKSNNGRYIITIDADGQHYPGDIKKIIPLLSTEGDSVVVGVRRFEESQAPARSRFGNEVANFWMKIETGLSVKDCQSGFRAYPVDYISKIAFSGSRYEFETEILTRSAWAGLDIKMVSVGVKYVGSKERVSHFDLRWDNLRIGLMHARLVGRRLMPFPHKRLTPIKEKIDYAEFLKHPIKGLKKMLKENATPSGLAAAAAMGIFLGVLPILSFHMPVILYFAVRLHLNKAMALGIQNICMPPLIPIACIELGHYMLYGTWITEASLRVVFWQLKDRVFEWLIGSLILAPVAATIAAVVVYFTARRIKRREADNTCQGSKEGTVKEFPARAGSLWKSTLHLSVNRVPGVRMSKKIKTKKRGNSLGIWFFIAFLKVFGLRGAYSLLNLVCFYYALFDKEAISAASEYVRRRFSGCSTFQMRRHIYRLFISQGRQLIDRYASVSGKIKYEVNSDVYDLVENAVGKHEKGAILLTGHVGNWQTSMSLLENLDKKLYIVMRPEDNPALVDFLKISHGSKINIISPEQEMGGAIEIVNALSQGGLVFMMGDRKYDFNTTEAVFLGDKAKFPQGAFRIAAAAGCPIIVWFSNKTSERMYNVRVKGVLNPCYRKGKEKGTQIKEWAQEFASLLEAYTKEHPYQCFLFHNVWGE